MPTVALIGPELFPVPPIRGGATELFIDRLAAHLKRYRPLVISPGDPDLPDRESRKGVEHRRVSLFPWQRWLYRRYRRLAPLYDRRVAGILRAFSPDLVHVHNRPLLALNLKTWFPRLPVLLHMHNLYEILGKRERPAPDTLIPVEAFLACSRFILEQERQRLGAAARARYVIYNGVDLTAFRPWWERQEEARALRRRYGLSHEPVVLFAGKIRESKGAGVLLAAMGRVWEKIPQAALALVGGTEFGRGRTQRETPFFRQFREQAAGASGRVILTGFLPHDRMAETYLLGDVLAAPSQKPEGLPMVLLEAAACGLPIVATPMGGIPEIIRDGDNGLLLDRTEDPEELAEKILTVLEDKTLARRLGEQGRRLMESRFSWKRIAREQEAVYDEVLGNFSGKLQGNRSGTDETG